MAAPNIETQVKVVSEAAENFVTAYYDTLNKRKDTSSFYVSQSPKLTAAGVVPDISINGHLLPSPKEVVDLLITSRGGTPSHGVQLEVSSFDAHPINPNYAIGADAINNQGSNLVGKGERISYSIMVSGSVKYGKSGEDGFSEQAFTEAWLLVPHWEAQGPRAPRGLRRWLVVSQNFRTL